MAGARVKALFKHSVTILWARVVALSGVKTVIWFEGINDLSHGQPAEAVIAGFRTGVAQLRKAIPGVRIVGATITPSFGAKGNHRPWARALARSSASTAL